MMRDAQGKTPSDMFPQLFENDDDDEWEPPLSEEDRKGLIADMTRMNEESAKKSGTQK